MEKDLREKVAECEELGIMGKEHWIAFLDFIKKQATISLAHNSLNAEKEKEIAELKDKLVSHKISTIDGDCEACDYESFGKMLKAKDSEIATSRDKRRAEYNFRIDELVLAVKNRDERIKELEAEVKLVDLYLNNTRRDADRYKRALEEIVDDMDSENKENKCKYCFDIASRVLKGGK